MQTVIPQFHEMAQNSVIPIDWGLRMSFEKEFDSDLKFFTLDESILNGLDLISPSDDNLLNEWDYYNYLPYSDRVITQEWSREIDFPFSVQAGMADFTLNNFDGYFTPNGGSPIQNYILPKRPIRLFAGFKSVALLQQFVGITQKMPTIDERSKTASFHALDFLSEMFSMPLTQTVAMSNVRTDEVLAKLFDQFGLLPTSYTLAKARNTIPFLFFEKGTNAGQAIRDLMQAEMGNLWIDEQGQIRFEQRLQTIEAPVMNFNDTNVIDITTTGDSEIINTVRIKTPIREVQEFQPIFTKSASSGSSDLWVVPANGYLEKTGDLQDPVLSAIAPTLGFSSSVSWFTALTSTGTKVTSGVAVSSNELRTNSYVMNFFNANPFPVEIDELELWGEPAKQVDELDYEALDEDSREVYGEEVLTIDSAFFQTLSNARSFALSILDAYSNYAGVIQMEVKGDPALQLGDVIRVDARSYHDEYKVIKITNTMMSNSYRQVIKARHYTPREWFQLNLSTLNSPVILAP